MDTAFVITISVLTALVVGLTEIAKQFGIPTRYAPLLAVGLGIAGTMGLAFFEPTTQVILTGVAVGLSACGLYDFSKKTVLNW